MIFWVSFSLFLVPLLTIIFRLLYRFYLILKSILRVAKKARTEGQTKGSRRVEALNHLLGSIEYGLRPVRNFTLGIYYLILFCKSLFFITFTYDYFVIGKFCAALLFLTLVFYSQTNWNQACLKIAEFARLNVDLAPQAFFKRLKQLLGPIPWELPNPLNEPTIDPTFVDFRKTHRPQQKLSLIFITLWDTAILAHICLKTMKLVGLDYTKPVFDVMASMWGKRVLERVHGAITVNGSQKLKTLKGKFILIFNHKSQLDFVFTFFALSHAFIASKRPLKPRFITAKDHFVDNPFVYDMIGVGKLIEAIDMVFIERTQKGGGQKDLELAAKFLANKDIDIAIFPQGTRAIGNNDRSGKRRDAGYYTTVPPKDITSNRGHLRKGAAFLAVDTLMQMAALGNDEELHILVIGQKGTATLLPKESFKMQTETEIVYDIMDPLSYSVDLAKGLEKPNSLEATTPGEDAYLNLVNEIHERIDQTLIHCLKINESLRHRFLMDLQGHFKFDGTKLAQIESRLDNRTDLTDTLYQMLDRTYGCPQVDWHQYLSQIAHLLMDDAQIPRFIQLRDKITQTMLGKLKTKLHGQTVKI